MGKFNDSTVLDRLRRSENRGVACVAIHLEIVNLESEQAMARCKEIAENDIPTQRDAAILALDDFLPKSIELLDELALQGHKYALHVLGGDGSEESQKVFDIICWHLQKNIHSEIRIDAIGVIADMKRHDFHLEIIKYLIFSLYDRSVYVQAKAADTLYHCAQKIDELYFAQFRKSLDAAVIHHPNPVVRESLSRLFNKFGYKMPQPPVQPSQSKLVVDCLPDDYRKYKAHISSLPDRIPKPPARYLSIEHSLLPMFRKKPYAPEEFAFNRINPEIRKYLLFYLRDPSSINAKMHEAIKLLGYVGQAEDIKVLDEYISRSMSQSSKNNPAHNMYHTELMYGAGGFAGMMIRRNIDGAEPLFRKCLENITLSTAENSVPNYESSLFLVNACSYSLEDYTAKALKLVADDTYGSDKRFVYSQIIGRESDCYDLTTRPSNIDRITLEKNMTDDYKQYKDDIDLLIIKANKISK